MERQKYLARFLSGKRRILDLRKVMKYSIEGDTIKGESTGVDLAYVLDSMEKGKTIVVCEAGETDIENAEMLIDTNGMLIQVNS